MVVSQTVNCKTVVSRTVVSELVTYKRRVLCELEGRKWEMVLQRERCEEVV